MRGSLRPLARVLCSASIPRSPKRHRTTLLPPPRPVATQCTPRDSAGDWLQCSSANSSLFSPKIDSPLPLCCRISPTSIAELKETYRAKRTEETDFERYSRGYWFQRTRKPGDWTKYRPFFSSPILLPSCATGCYDARFSRARLNLISISRFALFLTCTETL